MQGGAGDVGIDIWAEMDQGRAAVRNVQIPQPVGLRHRVDRSRIVAGLHVVIGHDDDHGLVPSIRQCVEHLADDRVGRGIALSSRIALGAVIVADCVRLVEVAKHEIHALLAERVEQPRQDLAVQGISVGVEPGARRDLAAGRPALISGAGCKQAAIVGHDGGRLDPVMTARLEDGGNARHFGPDPVRKLRVSP